MKLVPTVALRCFSHAPYPTKTQRRDGEEIQYLTYSIKNFKKYKTQAGRWVDPAAWVARKAHESAWLHPEAALVPVPRHSVTPPVGARHDWPSLRLAQALARKGCGAAVVPAVTRATAATHSSMSSPSDRATFDEHVASLIAEASSLAGYERITLVDDVLKKGTQLAAVAHVLSLAGYQGRIEAFTQLRT